MGGRDRLIEAEREVAELVLGRSGCCRMRRRPEAPRPCSCSGTMGDLAGCGQPSGWRDCARFTDLVSLS